MRYINASQFSLIKNRKVNHLHSCFFILRVLCALYSVNIMVLLKQNNYNSLAFSCCFLELANVVIEN